MRLLATMVALVAVAGWPCSLSGETEVVRFITPAPRSRGVPLNAEVKVLLGGPALLPERPFVLRDGATGDELALARTMVRDVSPGGRNANDRLLRLRPQQKLLPGREYVLLWGGKETTRFETGTAADLSAPKAPGRITSVFTAIEDACFGDTRSYELTFDEATDGQTPADQLIYLATLEGEDGTPHLAALTASDHSLGQSMHGGNLVMPEAVRLKGKLEAVDWAGNVGPGAEVSVSPGLAATRAAVIWRMFPEEVQVAFAGLGGCGVLAFAGIVFALRARKHR